MHTRVYFEEEEKDALRMIKHTMFTYCAFDVMDIGITIEQSLEEEKNEEEMSTKVKNIPFSESQVFSINLYFLLVIH